MLLSGMAARHPLDEDPRYFQHAQMNMALKIRASTRRTIQNQRLSDRFTAVEWGNFAMSDKLTGSTPRQTAYMRRLAFGHVAECWLTDATNPVELATILNQALGHKEHRISLPALNGFADIIASSNGPALRTRYIIDHYDRLATLLLAATLGNKQAKLTNDSGEANPFKGKVALVDSALQKMLGDYPAHAAPDRSTLVKTKPASLQGALKL